MRGCELCKRPARMYCESDKAMLCWNCDERVHKANFLVEKHIRCLLCQVCQSLTPWKASGSKLCPTASVCISCADNHAKNDTRNIEESEVESHDDNNQFHDDDYDQEYEDGHTDDDDYDDEEEEGDNQVVPWSSPPPAMACTSSTSNDESSVSALKRMLHERDLDSDDEVGFNPSSGAGGINDDLGFHRPMK